MAWTCAACTLVNPNPRGLACELCRTERPEAVVPQARIRAGAGAGQRDRASPGCSSVPSSLPVLLNGGRRVGTVLLDCGGGSGSEEDSAASSGGCSDSGSHFGSETGSGWGSEGEGPIEIVFSEEEEEDEDALERDLLAEVGSAIRRAPSLPQPQPQPYRSIANPYLTRPAREGEPPPPSADPGGGGGRMANPYLRRLEPAEAVPSPPPSDLEGRANALLRRYWGPQPAAGPGPEGAAAAPPPPAPLVLRPFQLGAALALAGGRDCLVVSGTGSGKSVCFQLPPLLSGGVAVVVSPLISLMRDQVGALRARGIAAEFLGSAQPDPAALGRALSGRVAVVYVCPEGLGRLGPGLADLLGRMRGGRGGGEPSQPSGPPFPPLVLAVDECHCVSKWSDFREAYTTIGMFREHYLPGVPCVAVTATATPRVREDVMRSLRLRPGATVAVHTFDRPNLHYAVRHCEGGTGAGAAGEVAALLLPLLREARTSEEEMGRRRRQRPSEGGRPPTTLPRFPGTIVYCPTRADCEGLAKALDGALRRARRNIGWRVPAGDGPTLAEAYHAGLDGRVREGVQSRWTRGDVLAVCATVAFGMGIDRPDVRLVCHVGWPQSLEAFHQESGRAGRDGGPARTVLLVPSVTVPRLFPSPGRSQETTEAATEMLRQMHEYGVRGDGCRRRFLLGYFGERAPSPRSPGGGCCDLCDRPHPAQGRVRLLNPAARTIRALAALGATEEGTGVHMVKPLFVRLAEGGGISSSWKWCRGLCRLLVRGGWLGTGIRTMSFTQAKRAKGGRGKKRRRKRRREGTAPTETVQRRVDVLFVTDQGRALLEALSGDGDGDGNRLRQGTGGRRWDAKVREAIEGRLALHPDLDMVQEARADPGHLRLRASRSISCEGGRTGGGIAPGDVNAGPRPPGVKRNASRPSPTGPASTRGGLLGWTAGRGELKRRGKGRLASNCFSLT